MTARKREESVLDVPTSITAVTGEALESKGVLRIDRLTESIPNITIQNNPSITGSVVTFIRGIGSRAVEPTTDPANALSIDGVYLAGVSAALLDTFDVQQIEVLRGPQGTLQGRNATGGAINVTTRRPSLTASGLRTDLGYGNFNTWTAKMAAETPIVQDQLAVKLSVVSTDSDGFVKHTDGKDRHRKGGAKYTTGRLGVLYEPSDTFNAYLTGDFLFDRSSQAANIPHNGIQAVPREETGGQVVPLICTMFNECSNYPLDKYSANATGGTDTDAYGGALTMNWNVGAVTLTSVTGYRKIDDVATNDVDATSIPLVAAVDREVDSKQFSEELRVSSRPGSSKLDWVVGAYHLSYKFDMVQPIELPAIGVPVSVDERNQEATSNALFANGDYALSDKWHVFAGARTQKDKKDFEGISPAGGKHDDSWSNFVAEAGVRFYINPDDMIYARFAQGSRPGGYTPTGTTYDPEEVDSYEIGAKLDRFDHRLILSTAVFYYDYKEMKRVVTVSISTPPFFQETVRNAADATIWGVDVELTAAPTDALRISGAFGYLDASYKHFYDFNRDLQQIVDNKDLRLPFTPKVTASLSGTYSVPINFTSFFTEAVLGIDASYKAKQNTGVVDIPLADQGGYALLNASIRLDDESSPDHYYLVLYANNLTDKEYIISGEPIATLGAYVVPGMPRTYGVRLGMSF
ncbi:MAG: TonB-dependent receptor [Steroidobacteraceae bacterium]